MSENPPLPLNYSRGLDRTPRLVTTALISGTTGLRDIFGNDVHRHFYDTYSLTVVSTILFDLMIKSQAEDYSPAELTQHVEAVIINDLKLADEQNPLFQSQPMSTIVAELYQILLGSVWPFLKDNPFAQMSAHLARVNFEIIEVTLTRLGGLSHGS